MIICSEQLVSTIGHHHQVYIFYIIFIKKNNYFFFVKCLKRFVLMEFNDIHKTYTWFWHGDF